MQVLFVASECAPFVKTGGLADVVGALPAALAREGLAVRVLLPAYPAIADALEGAETLMDLGRLAGGPARLLAGRAEGLDVIALEAPHLFQRPGNPYLGPDGADWPDNHLRFAALCQAASRLALAAPKGWRPDLINAHDWQAGLTPAYLAYSGKAAPPTVLTIHNIAFQGLFSAEVRKDLGLPVADFTPDGYEFYGRIGFLKAGLVHAKAIATVSPTYARELTRPAFGMGLEGLLTARRGDLVGILNGVDLTVWNPERDPHIAARYGLKRLERKAANRRAVAERFRLEPSETAPLFCVISRMTRQKGLDMLLEALPRLLACGASLAVLGSGERDLEDAFSAAAKAHPGRVGVVLGYDEALSHLLQAGADAILVPSRFEPCGLTQLYGLRYGTLPVVARTGGLADSVIDANEAALAKGVATGFQFAPIEPGPLGDAIERASALFAQGTVWRAMMRRAMRHPVGWDSSAVRYAALFRELVES